MLYVIGQDPLRRGARCVLIVGLLFPGQSVEEQNRLPPSDLAGVGAQIPLSNIGAKAQGLRASPATEVM
jgi:hypothetical protein